MKRARISLCILLFSVLLFQGCATLGEIARTLTSLKNLQFRLDNIGDFSSRTTSVKTWDGGGFAATNVSLK